MVVKCQHRSGKPGKVPLYLSPLRPGRASRVDAVVVHHVLSLPRNHRPAIRRLLSPARGPTVLRLETSEPELLSRSPLSSPLQSLGSDYTLTADTDCQRTFFPDTHVGGA